MWSSSWERKVNAYSLKPLCVTETNLPDSILQHFRPSSLFDISSRFTFLKLNLYGPGSHSLSQDPFSLCAKVLSQLCSPNLQLFVLLYSRPMGMFQPAVLSTAVWQDFLPFRLSQVMSRSDFFTTATA